MREGVILVIIIERAFIHFSKIDKFIKIGGVFEFIIIEEALFGFIIKIVIINGEVFGEFGIFVISGGIIRVIISDIMLIFEEVDSVDEKLVILCFEVEFAGVKYLGEVVSRFMEAFDVDIDGGIKGGDERDDKGDKIFISGGVIKGE